MRLDRRFLTTVAAGAIASSASGQFNNEWVEYTRSETMLSSNGFSSTQSETDLDWGDVDKDGWVDLVVVRKEPFTSPGKRTNLLFMNENGALTDRTAEYASASDVPGDQGFLTPTNDRDVILFDANNDTWLDIITCTTLSDGDPKHIGHPRVYMNLGEDGAGNWLGYEHQDARIPQLFSYSTGNPENPRFCSVAAGDVTGDGFDDLYFGDYDSSGAGGSGQPSGKDLNDRLLINDGTGHFSDESQARMTSTMLLSAFGNSVEIADMNLDGHNDIVKDTSLNFPQRVSVSYNNPANVGVFNLFDPFHNNAPYHTSVGDLNNDGRLDTLITDDGADRYRYNLSTDALGRVVWSASKTFQFLTGGDDGFGSNNLIADLDGDGWNDALIADVDVDIGGFGRRLHIYHNPGGTPGDEIILREERQSSSSSGWIGAKGLMDSDLRGTHDIAVFDIDNDGDNDLIISQSVGAYAYRNGPDNVVCQTDLGGAGDGTSELELCGPGLASGQSSTLRIENAPANEAYFLAYGFTQSAIPFAGGTIVPIPVAGIVSGVTSPVGIAIVPVAGGLGNFGVFMQAVVRDNSQPEGLQLTNAIRADFQP